MFNAEMIVGMWFVPVVLFILIPMSMLCIWAVHQILRKITDRIELIHKSAKEAQDKSPVTNLHPKPAA